MTNVYVVNYEGTVISTNELKSKTWRANKGKIDGMKSSCMFHICEQLRLKHVIEKYGIIIKHKTRMDADNVIGGIGKIFIDQLVKNEKVSQDYRNDMKFIMCFYDKEIESKIKVEICEF